jgi:hypothetical protein
MSPVTESISTACSILCQCISVNPGGSTVRQTQGRKGGKAHAEKLTCVQRSEIACKAAKAR